MSRAELRNLATLVAIVDEGTFARAAARLDYTQSTVSQRVSALERAVGGAVFERPGGPRPVRLTALGSLIVGRARGLLADAHRLDEAIDRFHAGGGRIDIGTFQSVSAVLLPSIVRRLRDERPDVDINLFEEEPEDPDLGDLDLLFYDGEVGGPTEHRKLLDDPYLLLARPGDFAPGPVSIRELDGAPLVAWPAVCDQSTMEQTLIDHGTRPRIVFRTAGNETILAMVRAGIGSAILPWLALEGAGAWSDQRLRVHELRPQPTRDVCIHWPAGRSPSPLVARAIEIAVEVAREISVRRSDTRSSARGIRRAAARAPRRGPNR